VGRMKDLLITIYGGGDDAVAAVQRIGEDWRLQLEASAAEADRLRLTEAEREAVKLAVKMVGDPSPITAPQVFEYAATLRSLLERTR